MIGQQQPQDYQDVAKKKIPLLCSKLQATQWQKSGTYELHQPLAQLKIPFIYRPTIIWGASLDSINQSWICNT